MITAVNTTVNVSAVTGSQRDFMTEEMSLLAGYYMIAICAVGCAESVLILYTFRRHPNLRFISCDLVQILCILDIFMALFAFPFIITSCIVNRWVFSDIGCQWYGFCMTAIGIGSMATLACIALERFLLINAMKHDTLNRTGVRMKRVAIVCIGLGTLVALLPFVGVGTYDHEPVFVSCAPAWWGKRLTDVIFIMLLFASAFVVPVCCIMFSYIGICVKVASIRIGHRRKRDYIKLTVMSFLMIGDQIMCKQSFTECENVDLNHKEGLCVDQQVQAAMLGQFNCINAVQILNWPAFILDMFPIEHARACFLLSWGPYAVFAVKQAFVSDINLSATENLVPVMMAKSYILWNPILYLGGNVHFRSVLKNDLIEMFAAALAKVSKKSDSENTENIVEIGFVVGSSEHTAEDCPSNKVTDTAPEHGELIKTDEDELTNGCVRIKGSGNTAEDSPRNKVTDTAPEHGELIKTEEDELTNVCVRINGVDDNMLFSKTEL